MPIGHRIIQAIGWLLLGLVVAIVALPVLAVTWVVLWIGACGDR